MNDEPIRVEPVRVEGKHTTTRGNGAKWLLGAGAAAVLIGGGYFAWKATSAPQTEIAAAYDDPYASEPVRAGPLAPSPDSQIASTDIETADASDVRPAPVRRAPARAATIVPEETIGIAPVSTASAAQEDDLIIPAPRRPVWSRTPSARRLSAMYPTRALERGREGEAQLACTIEQRGTLDCTRVSETPGGFGLAAVRVARAFRHAPTLPNGASAIGTPVNLRVVFRIEDNGRSQRYASRY